MCTNTGIGQFILRNNYVRIALKKISFILYHLFFTM